DSDGDGQPDADAFGRLILADGQPAPTPFPVAGVQDGAPRDAQGRALGAAGNLLYATADLDQTFLGAAARQARRLVDPSRDTALGLLAGARALLGPPTMRSRVLDDGSALVFAGYDPSNAPLLDLKYAYLQLLGDNNFDASV